MKIHDLHVTVHLDVKESKVLELLRQILKQGETNMSRLSDKLDSIDSSLNAAIARVQEDVASLQEEIEALKAKEAPTDEELARIDALQAKLDALDPVKPATLPPE